MSNTFKGGDTSSKTKTCFREMRTSVKLEKQQSLTRQKEDSEWASKQIKTVESIAISRQFSSRGPAMSPILKINNDERK